MNLKGFFHLVGSLSIYIFALFGGALITYLLIHSALFSPINSDSKEEIPFVVEKGANLKTIAHQLEEKQLVKHWWSIDLLSRLKESEIRDKIIVGEYKLSPSMTPQQLLDKILSGEVNYYQLTLPEGFSVRDLPKLVADTTLVPANAIQAALDDKGFMSELNIQGGSFEGYLFPETYKFTKPIDAKAVITRMVEEGRKRLSNEMLERTIQLGYDVHQIITLASIVEKETGTADDRKRIASVFHNRLRIGMPLQSDPTVIYGISNFSGNLTKEHLRTPSPYNTYLTTGLPPTPICNPGIKAIEAAIFPEDTDYLYFVAKGDGTSQFSSTLKQHNEAVKKYQLGRADLVDDTIAPADPNAVPKDSKKGGPDVLQLEELQKLNKGDADQKNSTAESASSSTKPKKRLSQLDPVRERPRGSDPLPFEIPPPGIPARPSR